MSQLPEIVLDNDDPNTDMDTFLRRVEERVMAAEKLLAAAKNRSPNADAHPTPPPYTGWSIFGHWMGGGD